jgi:hypothetical protein
MAWNDLRSCSKRSPVRALDEPIERPGGLLGYLRRFWVSHTGIDTSSRRWLSLGLRLLFSDDPAGRQRASLALWTVLHAHADWEMSRACPSHLVSAGAPRWPHLPC